jgi:hypothetical protein
MKVGDYVINSNLTKGEIIETKEVDGVLYTIIKWVPIGKSKAAYTNDQLELIGVRIDYQPLREQKLEQLGI